jgi:translation initiation factor 5B
MAVRLATATHQMRVKDAVMRDVKDVMGDISTESRGVFVQASTLGSLEALMEYLRSSKVPVAGVALGPVHKKDVVRASAMVEHEDEREFATILAFDVKLDPTAVGRFGWLRPRSSHVPRSP